LDARGLTGQDVVGERLEEAADGIVDDVAEEESSAIDGDGEASYSSSAGHQDC
jgi:hypothetical protein